MTSTIKVNNIQNQCGQNIINENSNTITIGASGDTVALAAGASQSGFGRTGTVDWQTGSIKTTDFTAVNGQGFFVNTTSGTVTMTLPASPSAGNIVAVADYAGTANNNVITINRNGEPIEGGTDNANLNVSRESKTFVYVDGTQGWVCVNSNDESAIPSPFITATGGTESTCGNYKIHTFTGPGDFTVSQIGATSANNIVSYMVVGGGGGGGSDYSGGGGAGGFREYKGPADCYSASPLNGNPGGTEVSVSATVYPITVGAGAASKSGGGVGNSGSPSIFSTVTSAGGGGGGPTTSTVPGVSGGSGGGGGGCGGSGTPISNGGSGNTPPVSPPQGNNGGGGFAEDSYGPGGGGGGAGAVGANGVSKIAGNGGAGVTTSITGSAVARAGGGGGGIVNNPDSTGGSGGSGGGGSSPPGTPTAAGAGTANTGGGGAAGGRPGGTPSDGAGGGSGIVIIRYKFQ